MSVTESNAQQSRLNDERLHGESMPKLTLGSHKKDSGSGHNHMVSYSESGTSGSCNGQNLPMFGSGIVRLQEEDTLYQFIGYKFILDLARYGMQTHIEAIHRNALTSVTWKARFQSYLNFLRAVEEKTDGNANWKYAWYCGSKQQISTILSYGFGHNVNSGIYGRGIYLSPVEYPLQSLQSSTVDEEGLRHLLLCRVILGRMELVHPGSEQCYPSSEEFDSGVDNLSTPTKYIVWCTRMNSHIFPEFVISIRAPPVTEGTKKFSIPPRKPSSPWIPFPKLISILSKNLTPDSIKLIQKHHADHQEKKITREELIRRVRQITGDELLMRVIKSYKGELSTSKGSKLVKSCAKCHQLRRADCSCTKNEGF